MSTTFSEATATTVRLRDRLNETDLQVRQRTDRILTVHGPSTVQVSVKANGEIYAERLDLAGDPPHPIRLENLRQTALAIVGMTYEADM